MVHHLQQHIENIGVGFFDFVEEQNRMRLFGNCLGQQTTLIKSDVARGRSNQAADRMALHVLAHIETNQVNAHDVGELLGCFRLADAGGATEQECANGLVALAQA